MNRAFSVRYATRQFTRKRQYTARTKLVRGYGDFSRDVLRAAAVRRSARVLIERSTKSGRDENGIWLRSSSHQP
jgi:hypothetical protein